MEKQMKNDSQWGIVRFEADVLQTGTESTCAKETGSLLILRDQGVQGSTTPNRSNS